MTVPPVRDEMVTPPFGIGDEVAVIPSCADWASDWRDVRLWIAAVHVLPGGGFEYWVCDAWPLPEKPALTDGFYMGAQHQGEPDSLSLVTASQVEAGEVERLREAVHGWEREEAEGIDVIEAACAFIKALAQSHGKP